MRGVKRGQESAGRRKTPRDRRECTVTAVKMANAHMASFFHTMKTE